MSITRFWCLIKVRFSLFMSILAHICMYVLENVVFLCIFLYIFVKKFFFILLFLSKFKENKFSILQFFLYIFVKKFLFLLQFLSKFKENKFPILQFLWINTWIWSSWVDKFHSKIQSFLFAFIFPHLLGNQNEGGGWS